MQKNMSSKLDKDFKMLKKQFKQSSRVSSASYAAQMHSYSFNEQTNFQDEVNHYRASQEGISPMNLAYTAGNTLSSPVSMQEDNYPERDVNGNLTYGQNLNQTK